MGRNLTNLPISASFQYLTQISGSELTDGLGADIDSLNITASYATNAGAADTATSASHAIIADSALSATTATSASHAVNSDSAISSSYALTASYAENVEPINTGSFYVSSSITDAQITFTQGDGSTEVVEVNNVSSSISASHAIIADSALAANTATSASHAVNADTATSASHAVFADTAGAATDVNALYTASVVDATISFLKGGGGTFPITVNNVANAVSSSHAVSSDIAISSSHALNADNAISSSYALTASYAENAGGATEWQAATAASSSVSALNNTPSQIAASSPYSLLYSSGSTITAADGWNAVIGGYGHSNAGSGYGGVIIGGLSNTIASNYLGGIYSSRDSTARGYGSVIIAANNSQHTNNNVNYSGIYSGRNHSLLNSDYGAILGGDGNTLSHSRSVVIGGSSLSTTKADEVVVPDLSVYGDTFISSSVLGTGSLIDNLGQQAIVTGSQVQHIVNLSQTEYDALTPDANTLYVIDGAETLGNTVISGSLIGEVGVITPASNTGSLDCSLGNYFTMTLGNAVDTRLETSNLQIGQTINLKLTNNATAAGTISFGPEFEFEGGTAFTATAATNAVDILTFVSFDGTSLQTVGVKNFS